MASTAEMYLEGQIQIALEGFASSVGGCVVSSLMLDLGLRSASISHVLVDCFGLLVVDAQARPSMTISGGSASKTWDARVGKGRRKRFANPLAANKDRVLLLREALRVCGRRLPDEYFSDLVVFAGADLDELKLDEASLLRVVDIRGLPAALRARHDFAINPGALEPHEISDMASLLRTLDRSDSPETRLRLDSSPRRHGFALPFARKPKTEVRVSDDALGLAPAATRLMSDRYPEAPTVSLKPARTGASPALLLLIVGAVAVWLFVYGGLGLVQARVLDLSNQFGQGNQASQQVSQPVPTPAAGSQGLENAKAVLRANAPEVFAQIDQPDSPEVRSSARFTSYTWHYIPDKGSMAGNQRWIALTFDQAGVLRGVDGP